MKSSILGIIFLSIFSISPVMSQSFNYNKAWQEVEQLTAERKDQSALELIKEINSKAKVDNNTLDFFKSNQKIANLSDDLNEFIIELESMVSGLSSPSKELTHLQLAHFYQNSKSNNAYEISKRTPLNQNLSPDRINEFSNFDYITIINEHFEKAISNEIKTTIPAGPYQEIIEKNINITLEQFTLYEMILNHYLNYQSQIDVNTNNQKLHPEKLLSEQSTFVAESFDDLDLKSTTYRQIETFKKLLDLAGDDDKKLLFYNLQRLDIFHNLLGSDVDELYNEAIGNLARENINKEVYPFIYSKVMDVVISKAGTNSTLLDEAVESLKQVIKDYEGGFGVSLLQKRVTDLEAQRFFVEFEDTYGLEEKIKYNINHKNIDQLYFKMIELTNEDVKYISDYRNNNDEKINRLANKPTFKSWEEHLPINKYHSGDLECNTFKVLKSGKYGILTSKSSDFQQSMQLSTIGITNISYSYYNSGDITSVLVVKNRKTGKPIKNATVSIFEQKYNRSSRTNDLLSIGTYKSNRKGQVKLPYQGKNLSLKIEYKNDIFQPGQNIYINKNNLGRNNYQEEVFYLDRAIYRPGQTVYFKTISLGHKNEIVTTINSKPLTIKLLDANYQIINSVTGKANDYGSFSSSFHIPENLLSGSFTLQSERGSQRFTVQEYKRPSFELKIDTILGGLSIGSPIAVNGYAKGYAGNAITGSSYSYQITRFLAYPRCYFWYPPQQTDRILISNGVGLTNENGLIKFTVTDDKPIYPFPENRMVSYEIKIKVIDASGESQETIKTINVSPQEFYLRPSLNEEYDVSKLSNITIEAFDANNNSIQRKVNVSIFKQVAKPFSKSFPWKSNVLSLTNESSDELVSEQIISTKGEVSIKSLSYGDYRMMITGLSEQNDTISFSKLFSVTNYKKGRFSSKKLLYSKLNKRKLEVGEQLILDLGSSKKIYTDIFIIRNEEVLQFKQKKVNHKRKLSYLISEKDRGGIAILVNYIYDNRSYTERIDLEVPYSNKELKIEYLTFRDLTKPGSQESYSLKVSPRLDQNSLKGAEVLVGMYDASLDALVKHQWRTTYFTRNYSRLQVQNGIFGSANYIRKNENRDFINAEYQPLMTIPRFKLFEYYGRRLMKSRATSAPMEMNEESDMSTMMEDQASGIQVEQESNEVEEKNPLDDIRTNLNETVFFYPSLSTDNKGVVQFDFKINDALTRWKLLTFAHTKDFAFGYDEREVVTQKELMIKANSPRLMRLGDQLWLTASISNLTSESMQVQSKISLEDGIYSTSLNHLVTGEKEIELNLKPGQTQGVRWLINTDSDDLELGAIKFTVSAISENHTDAETNIFPLISNQVQLVSSMPITVRSKQDKQFDFRDFIEKEGSVQDLNYTLELSMNPAWFAIQALPHQLLQNGDYTSLIADKLYTYYLGKSILNKNKDITRILQANKVEKNEFVTFLEKNQELKNVLLEATPWVVESIEEENTANALYQFSDENQINQSIKDLLNQLTNRQNEDGGFPWYKSAASNEHTTIDVSKNLLEINSEINVIDILNGSALYLSEQLNKRYHNLKRRVLKLEEYGPSKTDIDILILLEKFSILGCNMVDNNEAEAFYLKQTKKYWSEYDNGVMATIGKLFLKKDTKLVGLIKASFEDRLKSNEEIGAYLYDEMKSNNLEAHVEVMDFLIKTNVESSIIDEMKIWLIKHKQVNSWGNIANSLKAIEGLLMSGSLKEVGLIENRGIEIKLSGKDLAIDNINKAGGYLKKVWNQNPIDRSLGDIKIVNSENHVIYGAAFWKYIEDMDKVEANNNSPLKLFKSLYRKILIDDKEVLQPVDEIDLKIGDVVVSRILIKSDRDFDYIHLQDFRGAGLEPKDQMSKFKYYGSFPYFLEVKDIAANYFIEHLPKGDFVVENENVVVYKGQYSAGIARLQSYHSSEFNAFSNGLIIAVK